MRRPIQLLFLLISAMVMNGCLMLGVLSEPLKRMNRPSRSKGESAKAASAQGTTTQPEQDPVRVNKKRQMGIHWDEGSFDGASYRPDELKQTIMSKGFDGLAQHSYAEAGGDFDVDLDKTGKRMAFSSTRYNKNPEICLQSIKGKAVTLLTSDPASDMMPKFHPRKDQIAWCSNRYGNWDILVKPLDGGPRVRPMQVTFSSDDEIHPTWSPDGKLLAFSRYNAMDGLWKIWTWDSATRTLSDITEGLFPEFKPVQDGKPGSYTLVYQKHRRRDIPWYSIWTIKVTMGKDGAVEMSGSSREIVANDKWAAINPCWSPDGKYLAFATVRKSPASQMQDRIYRADDIWVVRETGVDLTQITSHNSPDWCPAWAADEGNTSGRLYFNSLRNGHENIWSVKPIVAGLLSAGLFETD
ncbi:MAG: TolB family protein [Planctomycetota bacterium]|jgi:Tol biopolymer transport system component